MHTNNDILGHYEIVNSLIKIQDWLTQCSQVWHASTCQADCEFSILFVFTHRWFHKTLSDH